MQCFRQPSGTVQNSWAIALLFVCSPLGAYVGNDYSMSHSSTQGIVYLYSHSPTFRYGQCPGINPRHFEASAGEQVSTCQSE